jgi:hypothetical protein
MVERKKISDEETVELQRLYSELPSVIAEWAEASRTAPIAEDSLNTSGDGDEKADSIIKRIVQLTEDSDPK